ncbi:23S rRNA (guanine(745)-N(1))-methyltransferase [Aestuariibacter halophilus]|uniref:23S rRNA (Guanine(745)-N(1))-methyltransferase n=1 Tax=Fluctibacter halophilus TaxID=226011 RepID=A0ABS8G5J4_9ALTE|nr:23S rRNA (guanine(745)-N(1))-methyltransferase [Aestuariibacter halophilus]MCC2615830.1 23S rRNA (guanine(745)-N(1))-methyltransferase [Aestuariibacter halophilus]
MWICPACRQAMTQQGRQWCCEQQHSYDCAKEGYVNLLLVQHKNSKDPGDNKAMINARRAFLRAGFYAPLAERIVEAMFSHLAPDAEQILDAGCGEGYYLAQLQERLLREGRQVALAGIDIAKNAVQKAAKAYPNMQFAVASSARLPVADSSVDGVLQVFAPLGAAEAARVLAEGGIWIEVSPGPDHLAGLKAMVYDTAQVHHSETAVPDGFALQESLSVRFDIVLPSQDDREHLLMMTPFYWRAQKQAVQRIRTELTSVQADFQLRVLRKRPVQ